MKCAQHDDDDDGGTRTTTMSSRLTLFSPGCRLKFSRFGPGPGTGSGSGPGKCCHRCRCQRDCQAVVLPFALPSAVCCLHVLLLLLRLFALKILFIAIARICTKISCIQKVSRGWEVGWEERDKADNEIVVTQFGQSGKEYYIAEYAA